MTLGYFHVLFLDQMVETAELWTFILCPQCREPVAIPAGGLPTYSDGLLMNKNLEQLDKEIELLRPSSGDLLETSAIGQHLKYKRGLLGM